MTCRCAKSNLGQLVSGELRKQELRNGKAPSLDRGLLAQTKYILLYIYILPLRYTQSKESPNLTPKAKVDIWKKANRHNPAEMKVACSTFSDQFLEFLSVNSITSSIEDNMWEQIKRRLLFKLSACQQNYNYKVPKTVDKTQAGEK